jgi:hypothetical protein
MFKKRGGGEKTYHGLLVRCEQARHPFLRGIRVPCSIPLVGNGGDVDAYRQRGGCVGGWYVCVCVCVRERVSEVRVCVCVRERKREGEYVCVGWVGECVNGRDCVCVRYNAPSKPNQSEATPPPTPTNSPERFIRGLIRSCSTERVMALLKSPEMKRTPSPFGPLGFLLWCFGRCGGLVVVAVRWVVVGWFC